MIDIKGFPLRLKNMLVNAFMLPFWYVAIYLFGPSIYNQSDIFLILSICIALTAASAFLAYANVYVDEMTHKQRKDKIKPFDHVIITKALTYQMVYMSFLMMISYLIPRLTPVTRFEFYGFVLVYFSPWVLYMFKTFELLPNPKMDVNKKEENN